MKKIGIALQPLTILLTVALLVLIIIDAYTYAWGNEVTTAGTTKPGISLSVCRPWNIRGCSQLWGNMGIYHKIALLILISSIPLTAIMILVTSLAVFTRVLRKQTSIIILILMSWIIFFTLVASVILRISKYTSFCNIHPAGYLTYSYYNHWQIYITLASLIVSFVITQIFALGGYFRPIITMLSFEGHYQRYDYPRVSNLEKNMVSVKELDNF